MSATFELEGQRFMASMGDLCLHSPKLFRFLLIVNPRKKSTIIGTAYCGGEKSRCGWLKDKFGLSWQVIPSTLGQLLHNEDPAKAKKAMEAMMKMDKIIIADLKKAVE